MQSREFERFRQGVAEWTVPVMISLGESLVEAGLCGQVAWSAVEIHDDGKIVLTLRTDGKRPSDLERFKKAMGEPPTHKHMQ